MKVKVSESKIKDGVKISPLLKAEGVPSYNMENIEVAGWLLVQCWRRDVLTLAKTTIALLNALDIKHLYINRNTILKESGGLGQILLTT